MSDIRIDIKNAQRVGLRFDEFPDQLREDLLAEIYTLGNELLALVHGATPVLTGRLQSQERLQTFNDPNSVSAKVFIAGTGTDFGKAAALEYGAHKPAKVSAHSMRLDHAWANELASPIDVMVDAYTRPTNIAERAYERGPLAEMQPQIIARLNAVIEAAVVKNNAE